VQIFRNLTQLADGDPYGLGVVEELRVDGRHVLDVVAFLRASGPTVFDRKTRTKGVSFAIFRTFATEHEALAHHLAHHETGTGVFDFTLRFVEGGFAYTWLLEDAGWEQITQGELTGVSVRTAYQLIGGRFKLKTTAIDSGPEEPPVFVSNEINGGGPESVYNDPPIDGGSAGDRVFARTFDGGTS
jgi:hypothetical protein